MEFRSEILQNDSFLQLLKVVNYVARLHLDPNLRMPTSQTFQLKKNTSLSL